MSKAKMPWLKDRLREIDRTPAGLARHLNISGPRVYEMIAGRRGMQPPEIEPTAEYLGWQVEELLKHLPQSARVVPLSVKAGAGAIPVLAATSFKAEIIKRMFDEYDAILTGETARYLEPLPALRGRTDIQCLYMASTAMEPWRDPGDLVLFEKERPPRERDYVVVYLIETKKTAKGLPEEAMTRVLVRQLLPSKRPDKLNLRQHNPRRDVTIDRKAVAGVYRVMNWEDVVR
jgi:hypothetical protein